MRDNRLRKHFEKWHPEYIDDGRVVSVEDYRRMVHGEDHDSPRFTNHVHIMGFTIPRKPYR